MKINKQMELFRASAALEGFICTIPSKMCPSLFGNNVLIYSLLLSDEFPPLSSEHGACTPLRDPQLTLTELC